MYRVLFRYSSMTLTKYEIDKFTRSGDFTLWVKKIKIVLPAIKATKALEDPNELLATVTNDEYKQTMEETTYTTFILNISNNVLK